MLIPRLRDRMQSWTPELIAERMRGQAVYSADDSPLYARLSEALADDPVVHGIIAAGSLTAPIPLNLFAAVHYLLAQGRDPALASHYPSLAGPGAEPTGDPVALFRDFGEEHRAALEQLVATRGVQTNEVLRCTALMPAFATVAASDPRPLWLIELGPSAGLNLLFDRYHYDYGSLGSTGPEDSPLTLATELRAGEPPVPSPLPEVAGRVGVDLDPIDLTDADAVAWIRALIWPEQVERLARLKQAITIALADPPPVVAGDAVEALPALLAEVPDDTAPVVFHSFALNQVPEKGREQIEATLRDAGRHHTVHRVSMEILGAEAEVTHTRYAEGSADERVLGTAHFHGRWLAWR